MSRATMSLSACCGIVLFSGMVLGSASLQAAGTGVGFLVAAPDVSQLGAESRAAWEWAARHGATLILVSGDGTFVDQGGATLPLDRFQILWYHEGGTSAPTSVGGARSFPMLRGFVTGGGRLFLSGAAAGLIHTLGVEPVVLRQGEPGPSSYDAGIVPVVTEHPVFRGFSPGGGTDAGSILLNDGPHPAFADFAGTGGPTTGMLLGRANCGDENPLVEYQLGTGRIMILGWRLPFFSNVANSHRANLERLTSNILAYLADAGQWQKVVVGPATALQAAELGAPESQWNSLDIAIRDLSETFGARYPRAAEYRQRLAQLRQQHDTLVAAIEQAGPGAGQDTEAAPGKVASARELAEVVEQFHSLLYEALLSNPLMQFDRLLLVERASGNLALPANWDSNSSLSTTGIDNRLCVLSPVRPDGELATLYQGPVGRFVGDVDLHFDADRLLFSMPGSNGRWQVHELTLSDRAVREWPLIREPDVDNYDACYLPDGRILFTSTAPFVGVPCVYGGSHVTNSYLWSPDGTIRQLTVDQEHNWCPTVLNNGRVLYLRWEYTDLPHAHSRRLFHMNPDGTAQMEYLSSNSYFPNSFFYARPIPGEPTKVVGIATGHHGVARAGRLLVMDPARGRHEASGVVREIPGYGKKVPAIIRDPLVDGMWPQFLHPYPLSDKYFLVAAKPTPAALWGIYLVDAFDNMLLLRESPGYALFEPIPLQPTLAPPIVADRVDLRRNDALVYLSDVYSGPGLAVIPRGTVKNLRLVTYHFSYRGMGGLLGAIGMDGPWDIKRVLGTVPVEEDGSALFRVPANTPITVQPLDGDGQALQLMRSWFTAMPGETLSCVGCHESQNSGAPNRERLAARRPPSEISPWRGPVRGFAFMREVQPVLDRHCVACHDGQPQPHGEAIADLRGTQLITDWRSDIAGHVDVSVGGKFSVSYGELHRFVRRPGIESDIHLLAPMEYHAGTTELVQLLRKGHYGVELDAESWDRLITWIDLNAPYHGTWTEIAGEKNVRPIAERKRALLKRYAGVDDDPEAIGPAAVLAAAPTRSPDPQQPEPRATVTLLPTPRETATVAVPPPTAEPIRINLGDGVDLELVHVPAGTFVMGNAQGPADEQPATPVTIERGFWMGRYEVTNAEYACFDPGHDSHVEAMHGYQFGIHGYPLNAPRQPVVRVSWNNAMAFCEWLSHRTGRKFTLPTEAQWEYACRAGTATPFSYGELNTDFSRCANAGDARLRELALDTYIQVRIVANPSPFDDWVPKDARFNDGCLVSSPVGSYQPNAWGLSDMHGNVWEWTRSAPRPYPYRDDDRNDLRADRLRVVRGGSWYDRPQRGTSSYRLSYPPYEPVFNVGFRVVMEEP